MTSPILETERLWLRLLETGDAAAITQYASDRRVAATTLNIPHPYSIDMAHQFITGTRQAAAAGDGFTFAMTHKPQRQLIGIIDLRPQHGHSAEVGYWTGVPFWSQGYMSEALRAIIRHAFCDLGSAARVCLAFRRQPRLRPRHAEGRHELRRLSAPARHPLE